MSHQSTLAHTVACLGVGLHSGQPVRMTLHSAPPGSGIVFERRDVPAGQSRVPARYDAVRETRLGTTLRNRFGVGVATVEHLMAALWGAGVDNALIELDGPEVPIMDGSAEPFLFLLECAGLKRQNAPRRLLRILKTVTVRDGGSVASFLPNTEGEEGLLMDIEIAFENSLIRCQKARYDFRDLSFKQAIARARTFGFEHEVVALRKAGLALGGSLDNAVVVGKDRVLNEGGLRYGDEFVRHKALDCIGDLYLAGLRIDGHCRFMKPGHAINNHLLRALFADDSAYAVVEEGALPAPLPARAEAMSGIRA